MTIQFDAVPANLRVPLVYVEFSGAGAGLAPPGLRTLLIGQRLAAGSAAAGATVQIYDEADAIRQFGRGSMLAHMAAAFRRQHLLGDLWAHVLDDAATATEGTWTLTVTGAATAAGAIALYVAGRRVAVGVASGDTVSQIGAAIAAAVTARPDLPVTAAVAAGVVTLTARHGGDVDLDVRHSFHPDERLPAGVALAIAVRASGAVDPDVSPIWAALGDEQYDFVVLPYTARAAVTSLAGELAARWGPLQQIEGVGVVAYRGATGTAAQATTYGNALNSPHLTVMDVGKSPTPTYEWAASVAGQLALAAEIDPARPFQTLPLHGVVAGAPGDRRTFVERNTLLSDGISTHHVGVDGTVRIERMITTYQTGPGNVPDTAYLDLNTPLTLGWIRRDFRGYVRRKYPRHKLADDGTRFGTGQAVMTPSIGRAEAIARYRAWEDRGLVEGAEAFKASLICERNARDRSRLDWLMRPDLANGFRVAGAHIAFLT